MSDLKALEARIRVLEDTEAVKKLMARYWRCLDDKLWAELPDCFTPDVIGDYGQPGLAAREPRYARRVPARERRRAGDPNQPRRHERRGRDRERVHCLRHLQAPRLGRDRQPDPHARLRPVQHAIRAAARAPGGSSGWTCATATARTTRSTSTAMPAWTTPALGEPEPEADTSPTRSDLARARALQAAGARAQRHAGLNRSAPRGSFDPERESQPPRRRPIRSCSTSRREICGGLGREGRAAATRAATPEQRGRAREGEPRGRRKAVMAAEPQTAQRGGGHQVARRVIESLHRQRRRTLGSGPALPASAIPQLIWTRLSKPRRSLHGPLQPYAQSATSTRSGPQRAKLRPRRSPGAKGRRGDSRGPRRPRRRAALESVAVGAPFEIESGAALSDRDLRNDARLVPIRRIDAKHIGAEGREKARRNRPRQHPREIEDANSRERPRRMDPLRLPCRGRPRLPRDQGLRLHGPPLRMDAPLRLGSASAPRSRPPRRRPPRAPRSPGRVRSTAAGDGLFVGCDAQHGQGRLPVMRRVRMEPDPTIPRAIVAGDRIPGRRAASTRSGEARKRNQIEASRRSTSTRADRPSASPTSCATSRPPQRSTRRRAPSRRSGKPGIRGRGHAHRNPGPRRPARTPARSE